MPSKKKTAWAQYQTLLKERPFTMMMVQGGLIAAAGNTTAQLGQHGTVSLGPLMEQVTLNLAFITPVVYLWFGFLGGMRLHWVAATAVDQFLFSPLFNIAIFWFISAVFKGGVAMSARRHLVEQCTNNLLGSRCTATDEIDRYELSLSLSPPTFPPLSSYHPVWSTQVNAYYLWLPATLMREKFVPPHLKGIFVNVVAFVWNIIFSVILGA